MLWLRTSVLMIMMGFIVIFTACESEGPAEQAGEKLDEAAEEAKDEMEQAGEHLEETAEEVEEKME